MYQSLESFYKGKKVFITGNTGFKGSWLTLWLMKMGAEVKGYALAPETKLNHFDLLNLPLETIIADVRDENRLRTELKSFRPDLVFHLAAQPLVRRSYKEPINTYSTNVMGTLNLLEACRAAQPKGVIIITSDKVYENREWNWPYREEDKLGGFDLYSSSKACTEILTTSYQRSFFPLEDYKQAHDCLIATARAGNVIGGGDWSEDRLIPDIVKSASRNEAVEIRNPNAVRPWQHVLDPLVGYLTLGALMLKGQSSAAKAWNFGPEPASVMTVGEVLQAMQTHWTSINAQFPKNIAEPHEAKLLSVDSSQATYELNWKPKWKVSKAIEHTALWYKQFYESERVCTEQQLDDFLSLNNQSIED